MLPFIVGLWLMAIAAGGREAAADAADVDPRRRGRLHRRRVSQRGGRRALPQRHARARSMGVKKLVDPRHLRPRVPHRRERGPPPGGGRVPEAHPLVRGALRARDHLRVPQPHEPLLPVDRRHPARDLPVDSARHEVDEIGRRAGRRPGAARAGGRGDAGDGAAAGDRRPAASPSARATASATRWPRRCSWPPRLRRTARARSSRRSPRSAAIAYFRPRDLVRLAPLGLVGLGLVHVLSPGAFGSVRSSSHSNEPTVPRSATASRLRRGPARRLDATSVAASAPTASALPDPRQRDARPARGDGVVGCVAYLLMIGVDGRGGQADPRARPRGAGRADRRGRGRRGVRGVSAAVRRDGVPARALCVPSLAGLAAAVAGDNPTRTTIL